MAQLFLAAEDFPVGTKLRDLNFGSVYESGDDTTNFVEVILDGNGRKVFYVTSDYRTRFFSNELANANQQEIFLGCYGEHTGETSRSMHTFLRFDPGNPNNSYRLVMTTYDDATSPSVTLYKTYFDIVYTWDTLASGTPTISNVTGPVSLVSQINGNDVKFKAWGGTNADFSANEPGTWDFEHTLSSANDEHTTGIPALGRMAAEPFNVAVIGIGTGGDPAPRVPPTPDPIVATPSNPTESNITATGADLSWS